MTIRKANKNNISNELIVLVVYLCVGVGSASASNDDGLNVARQLVDASFKCPVTIKANGNTNIGINSRIRELIVNLMSV